jgi:hypothetical protein
MKLFEEIIIYIIEHFSNPIFEPIIIDKKILILFEKFVSKLSLNKSNIKLLKRTRNEITKLQSNDFLGNKFFANKFLANKILTVIFHQNFLICIDILIQILEKNDKIILHNKKIILHKKKVIRKKKKVINEKKLFLRQKETIIAQMIKEYEELKNLKRKFTSITAKNEMVIYFTLS